MGDAEQQSAEATTSDRARAAVRIQKHYRGYRERRQMAIADARYRNATRPKAREERGGPPSVPTMQHWDKAVQIAKRIQQDELGTEVSGEAATERGAGRREDRAKMMDMRYFLEMVDLKHRHGSNLRHYHEVWKQQDTKENFFYWLDHGEGRTLSLTVCPRERLERERVRYLSREERQSYLVKIDECGLLCWAKNGERIDTTERFKDSQHGIIPVDTEDIEVLNRDDLTSLPSSPSSCGSTTSDSSSHDKVSSKALFHYGNYRPSKHNKWIFVADLSFRLYVGIKQSGAFQHSSFLQGGRVSAAGLIKIKNGRLKSLSPLSGHYRPSATHFRGFVRSLKEAGVDMHSVSITKSYAVLLGMEVIGKAKEAKAKGLEKRPRDKALRREEDQRQENGLALKVMQKLNIKPAEPKRADSIHSM